MVYFARQWQETLLISLHNMLAVSFQVTYCLSWENSFNFLSFSRQCLPQPKLTAYNEEASKITRLQTENDHLKIALSRVNGEDGQESNSLFSSISVDNLPPGLDMVDEFYLIPGFVHLHLLFWWFFHFKPSFSEKHLRPILTVAHFAVSFAVLLVAELMQLVHRHLREDADLVHQWIDEVRFRHMSE